MMILSIIESFNKEKMLKQQVNKIQSPVINFFSKFKMIRDSTPRSRIKSRSSLNLSVEFRVVNSGKILIEVLALDPQLGDKVGFMSGARVEFLIEIRGRVLSQVS